MASTYLKKYKKDINLKIQDTDINPINTKQQNLNGFLVYCIVHYIDSMSRGKVQSTLTLNNQARYVDKINR